MNQDTLDDALRVATQMASDRRVEIDQGALRKALIAVMGERDGRDEPHEIAEEALELLGKDLGPSNSRRARRPF